MNWRRVLMSTCAVGISFVTAGCATSRTDRDLKALGLEYRLQELHDPRPNRVHILRLDLARGRIEPAVVIAADPDGDGPAEAELAHPLALADAPSVLAFINTNPWDSFPNAIGKKNRLWHEGQPVDIHGLAVSARQPRSLAQPGGASVWVDERGRVFLGDVPRDRTVTEGMAGFQQIVREGTVVAASGGPQHPRTAIGVDRSGTVLWLVVVDGRQPRYSEGMTLAELGSVLRDLGCWNATNMDGGGSSIMGLAGPGGHLQIVNSPSDRILGVLPKIRPLPMVLTIRKKPVSRGSVATDEFSSANTRLREQPGS